MATRFGFDPEAVRRTAHELTGIGTQVQSGRPLGGDVASTGCPPVDEALRHFATAAADSTTAVAESVQQMSAAFDGLLSGELELDRTLYTDLQTGQR